MEIKAHSTNESKDAYYSLKSKKSPGYDNISYNVIKKCFESLREPLKRLKNRRLKNSTGHSDL